MSLPNFLLWEINILNISSRISVQFTMIFLTWHYFTSYSIVLSAGYFNMGVLCFRCQLFLLPIKKNIRYFNNFIIILSYNLWLWLVYIGIRKVFLRLISDMIILCSHILILWIYCMASFSIYANCVIYLLQKKYHVWLLILIHN